MIRTAIISVTASFLLFGAWAVNLVKGDIPRAIVLRRRHRPVAAWKRAKPCPFVALSEGH
jgi:hypothetical protein